MSSLKVSEILDDPTQYPAAMVQALQHNVSIGALDGSETLTEALDFVDSAATDWCRIREGRVNEAPPRFRVFTAAEAAWFRLVSLPERANKRRTT